jgi:hypothetical protein
VVLAGGVLLLPGGASSAADEPAVAPTPQRACNAGSRPETSIQGRVPQRDYDSGRARQGYSCNTRLFSHIGASGGFKVYRYVDAAGHTCVFYDSTRLAPTDLPYNVGSGGIGTFVVDVSDPSLQWHSATIQTLAMDSPHESLNLNRRRGLLAAVAGNPATLPGLIDVYSVRRDCRHPVLQSSIPYQGLGHESGFAPDGRTFYASATSGYTLAAIDLTDPRHPATLATYYGVNYHGLRVSPDGNRMYVANIGTPSPGGRVSVGGLRILDTSQIQARRPDPQVRTLSDLSWRQKSIPQAADPLLIGGHRYVLESDEFANFTLGPGLVVAGGYEADAPVGAARLINIDNARNPFVVSDLRLAVHQLKNRSGPQKNDPGANSTIGGYTGHYCSAPRYRNPGIVACSMIGSGLRIFDVRHPYHPREVGYFNRVTYPNTKPNGAGGLAYSAPAWDLRRRLVYYSDGLKGLYAVRLAKAIVPRHYWD